MCINTKKNIDDGYIYLEKIFAFSSQRWLAALVGLLVKFWRVDQSIDRISADAIFVCQRNLASDLIGKSFDCGSRMLLSLGQQSFPLFKNMHACKQADVIFFVFNMIGEPIAISRIGNLDAANSFSDHLNHAWRLTQYLFRWGIFWLKRENV